MFVRPFALLGFTKLLTLGRVPESQESFRLQGSLRPARLHTLHEMPFPAALRLGSSTSLLEFRFAPGLYCVTYTGDKEERACLQQDLRQESRFHVLLTTYEVAACFPAGGTPNWGP